MSEKISDNTKILTRSGKATLTAILNEVEQTPEEQWETAAPDALDGDVILAAQALLIANEGNEVIIATTNVGHLCRFVDAREFQNI